MLYLPQQPYLFRGTLSQQILYPDMLNTLSYQQMSEFLDLVGLSYLLTIYEENTILNWNNILSPGEQQLISFARLFYHK